jgi:hypothetical protein
MHHKLLHRLHVFFSWHYVWIEQLIALFLVVIIFTAPASADMRFEQRSLYVRNVTPSAVTDYTVSLRYMSPQAVGSLDLLVCIDPIPYHECVTPPGFDASNVTLSEQSGETGFSILSKSANRIVLSRAPQVITTTGSSYKFENVKNPTDTSLSYSIRMKSHNTSNATGPQIDFGSVKAQVTNAIVLQAQVPPMLIFCIAEEVMDNCAGTNDNFYKDLGTFSNESPLVAYSQMAVGTNASGGFAITANGAPPSAGTNVIDNLEAPAPSTPGTNQFGINLVQNTDPAIGQNPEGTWANAIAAPGYDTPNMYKYVPGEVVAYSPNVSLMKKFTVSYLLNASPTLRAGVYTTTITYVASGQF